MKIQNVTKKIYSVCNKVKFKAGTHSPEILVITGVIGAIAGAVLACTETIKAEDIIKEAKEKREIIESVANDPAQKAIYSDDDHKKDIALLYGQTALRLLKVYAPALIVEGLSVASILTGHDILRKRSAAIAAAYSALDKGYKEYRKRVSEAFGEDAERRIYKGLKVAEIDTPCKDEEGRDMTEKKIAEVRDKRPVSQYARLFDEVNSKQWDKHPGYNLNFIKNIQRRANDILKSRGKGGVLFLNEVYDMLGFERVFEGWDVGWIYDPKNPNLHNFVDFGLYDKNDRDEIDAFLYGEENSVWLDFNIDGLVRDMLPRSLSKKSV